MWGLDSAHIVAELALTDSRTDSIHDPQYGVRSNFASIIPGGAADGRFAYHLSAARRISRFSLVMR